MKISDLLCQDVFTEQTMVGLEIPKPIQTRVRHLFERYTTKNWPNHPQYGFYYGYTLGKFRQEVTYEKLLRDKNVGWKTIGAINRVLRYHELSEFKPAAVLALEAGL